MTDTPTIGTGATRKRQRADALFGRLADELPDALVEQALRETPVSLRSLLAERAPMAARAEEDAPRRFGQYEILDQLGAGPPEPVFPIGHPRTRL